MNADLNSTEFTRYKNSLVKNLAYYVCRRRTRRPPINITKQYRPRHPRVLNLQVCWSFGLLGHPVQVGRQVSLSGVRGHSMSYLTWRPLTPPPLWTEGQATPENITFLRTTCVVGIKGLKVIIFLFSRGNISMIGWRPLPAVCEIWPTCLNSIGSTSSACRSFTVSLGLMVRTHRVSWFAEGSTYCSEAFTYSSAVVWRNWAKANAWPASCHSFCRAKHEKFSTCTQIKKIILERIIIYTGEWDESMNVGKRGQLGKHGFGSVHNITWASYHNADILFRHWLRFTNEVD